MRSASPPHPKIAAPGSLENAAGYQGIGRRRGDRGTVWPTSCKLDGPRKDECQLRAISNLEAPVQFDVDGMVVVPLTKVRSLTTLTALLKLSEGSCCLFRQVSL